MLRFHHIGIAVYDFEKVVQFYIDQGYRQKIKIYDPEQNVEVCVLEHPSSPTIELLAPHDEKSPINNVLEKTGASPYHNCYLVSSIETAVSELKRKKFMVVSKPKASCAFDNRLVAFLYDRDIGLVELMEDKNEGV